MRYNGELNYQKIMKMANLSNESAYWFTYPDLDAVKKKDIKL